MPKTQEKLLFLNHARVLYVVQTEAGVKVAFDCDQSLHLSGDDVANQIASLLALADSSTKNSTGTTTETSDAGT